MLIIIALSAFVATFLGGMFAIRFRDKLHLVLGFSAGAIIAVAFFDLIPEAIELGGRIYDPSQLLFFTALGFMVFMILDRLIILHSHHDDVLASDSSSTNTRGKFGAGSLSIHSFLDGIAIGLAFQVSSAVGIVVAVAVLVHDFSDGINTVNLILKNGGTKKTAYKWLTLDAISPVVGVISTFFFSLPETVLAIVLAMFAGFFLYIGASDLLPESHHSHPTFWTTAATVLGMCVLYTAIHFAGV